MDLTELSEIAWQEQQDRPPVEVRCCVAAGCVSANSEAVLGKLRAAADAAGLGGKVKVSGVGCLRLCCQGPLVRVEPYGALYQKVTPENAASIVQGLDGGAAAAERADPNDP